MSSSWFPNVTHTFTEPIYERKLSKTAKRGLASKRVVATIERDNPDYVTFNTDKGRYKPITPQNHQRHFNLEQLLHHHKDTANMLSITPYFQLPDVKSIKFLSFKMYPNLWLNLDEDVPIGEGVEFDGIDLAQSMFNPYLEYKGTSNTSIVEQDTKFPDIRRCATVNGVKNVCVIVGDPGVIESELNPKLPFLEASDHTFRSFYGLKDDDTKEKFKRSNDFLVLAGLDTKASVFYDGNEYEIDFMDKTERMGCRIIPLLATSPTELVRKLQVQILDNLHKVGQVQLNEVALDPAKRMYALADDDKASGMMGFLNSNTGLFIVHIYCEKCGERHDDLFLPNQQEDVQMKVSTTPCRACNTTSIVDQSAFSLREAKCRMSLDPCSARNIKYEVSVVKKEKRLPTGITSVNQLQPFEYTSPMATSSVLPIALGEDASRKNQRTTSVYTTFYVPTTFNLEKTLDGMKKEMEEMGLELTPEDLCNGNHMVEAYVYHDGEERCIHLVATRVKISSSFNKVLETTLTPEKAEELKSLLGPLKHCVEVQAVPKPVVVHIPSYQTCRRIGVQTVSQYGDVYRHTSKVMVTPKARVGGKKQKPEILMEEGTMMNVSNVWCNPDYSEKENFLSQKRALTACFVNNIWNQGSLASIGAEGLSMLPLGSLPWLELDEINGTISPEVQEKLLRSVSKQLKSKNKVIKGLEDQLEKEKVVVKSSKEVEILNKKVKELEENLKVVTQERDELKKEKKCLEGSLRVVKRECVNMKERCETLEKNGKKLEEKLVDMERLMDTKDKAHREEQDEMKAEIKEIWSRMDERKKGSVDRDRQQEITPTVTTKDLINLIDSLDVQCSEAFDLDNSMHIMSPFVQDIDLCELVAC